MKKKILSLLSIFLLMVLTVNNVYAIEITKADNIVNDEGTYDSLRLVAGNKVTSKATIDGISFIAGNDLYFEGNSTYGMYAGNLITVNGNIEKDLLVAGNKIIISEDATIGRDVYLAGSQIEVKANLARDLRAGGDTIDLSGITNEYGFNVEQNFEELTYTDSNSKSERGNSPVPRYNIISKTTLDIFKQIVNGDNVVYIVVQPVKVHSLPSESANASRIAVLNYHFFYDPEIGETCPDGNCKKVQDFERELTYLKQNNYKALTMDEFTKWMYGEIELPARSVLISIDDGAMGSGAHNGNKLIPILEKYNMHATLFLISGWWSIDNYRSPYLDIESHTFDMHEGNYCEGVPRGSKLLCSSREQVLEDLSKSAEITGSKNAFCFPMYVYNDTTFDVLKEIGFKLAFVGGDVKASRSNDKYKVPRYHIYRDTSLDQFIVNNAVNEDNKLKKSSSRKKPNKK